MNQITVNMSHSIPQTPLISDAAFLYINIFLGLLGSTTISVCGTLANTLNAYVFIKQGLQDSVSISLLALSLSDLCCMLLACMYGVCSITYAIVPDSPIHFETFKIMFAWARTMFADLSIYITVQISVDRCLCVIFPFQFKSIASRKRTMTYLSIILAFTLASYAPVFATHGMSWQFDPTTNRSVYMAFYRAMRPQVETFSHFFTSITMTTVCMTVVFACAVLMMIGLQRSSLFRKNAAAQSKESTISLKERKVIIMVFLVAAIMFFCNLPTLLSVWVMRFVPEVRIDSIDSPNMNMAFTLGTVSFLCNHLGGSVNIFVYHKFISSFRSTFNKAFGCCKVKEKQQSSRLCE